MLHTFDTAGGCGCVVTWDTRETWVRVQYCERHEPPLTLTTWGAWIRANREAERKQ